MADSICPHCSRPSPWIPVGERLPGPETVIVNGGVARLGRDRKTWLALTGMQWPGRPIEWPVTHWMPLPLPPGDTDG